MPVGLAIRFVDSTKVGDRFPAIVFRTKCIQFRDKRVFLFIVFRLEPILVDRGKADRHL